MTKPQLAEELKKLGVEVDEAKLGKEELEVALSEARAKAGLDEDGNPVKGPEGEAKPPEAPAKKSEPKASAPVLIQEKGKFSLFSVEGGYLVKDNLDRVISPVLASKDEAEKLFSDLHRNTI